MDDIIKFLKKQNIISIIHSTPKLSFNDIINLITFILMLILTESLMDTLN